MIQKLPETSYPTPHHCVKDMIERYQRVYQYTQKVQAGVIRRNAKLYAGLAKFKAGDLVWYFSVRPPKPIPNEQSKPAKHVNRWIGPWVVEAQVSEVLYRIRPYERNNQLKPMVTNVSKLREFKGTPEPVSYTHLTLPTT